MSFWTAITGLVPRTSRGNVHPAVKVAGAAATIGAVTWLAIATPFVATGSRVTVGKPIRMIQSTS